MKKNQKQLDELICKEIIDSKSKEELLKAKEFIQSLNRYKKVSKLYSTYYKGIKKAIDYNKENKVYVDFKFGGTTTGRLSCAKYDKKGVSFHTLPRGKTPNIRGIFNAPDDWWFLTADYEGMELKVLAHICQDAGMIAAIKSGKDLHSYTASLIFEKPIEQITKEERQIAKSVSFLIVYGGGAYKLSSTVGISLDKSQKIIDKYEEIYPSVFIWMDEVREFVHENQYVISLFGGRRNLPDIKSTDKKVVLHAERQAINFKIQRVASDILLYCLMDTAKEFSLRGLQGRIISTVHDSLEIVCPKEEIKEICELMYHNMIYYPSLRQIYGFESLVPFGIEVLLGKAFDEGKKVEFKNGKVINLGEIINENI